LGELEAAQSLATARFRVFVGPSIAAALSVIPLIEGSRPGSVPVDGDRPAQARP
jgi:hypothetical protein